MSEPQEKAAGQGVETFGIFVVIAAFVVFIAAYGEGNEGGSWTAKAATASLIAGPFIVVGFMMIAAGLIITALGRRS